MRPNVTVFLRANTHHTHTLEPRLHARDINAIAYTGQSANHFYSPSRLFLRFEYIFWIYWTMQRVRAYYLNESLLAMPSSIVRWTGKIEENHLKYELKSTSIFETEIIQIPSGDFSHRHYISKQREMKLSDRWNANLRMLIISVQFISCSLAVQDHLRIAIALWPSPNTSSPMWGRPKVGKLKSNILAWAD